MSDPFALPLSVLLIHTLSFLSLSFPSLTDRGCVSFHSYQVKRARELLKVQPTKPTNFKERRMSERARREMRDEREREERRWREREGGEGESSKSVRERED